MDQMDALDATINNLAGDLIPPFRLFLALTIGVIIGWEREFRENIAGLRIMPLVAVGATLFAGYGGVDGTKFVNTTVAGGVVTGVGFLGAGVIMRERGTLTGVITAATIWVTAALGMGIALGLYGEMMALTGAILLILWVFPRFSYGSNHNIFYEIVAPFDEARYKFFQQRFMEHKLAILRHSWSRNSDQMTCVWYTNGLQETHEWVSQIFINDLEITEFNTKLS